MTEADRADGSDRPRPAGRPVPARPRGVVRWTFTEAAEGGRHMFGAPNTQELMSAVAQVTN